MDNLIYGSILIFIIIYVVKLLSIYNENKIFNPVQVNTLREDNSYINFIYWIMGLSWIILTLIYIDLSFYKKINFVDSYKFEIKNNSVIIGSGDKDEKNTYLTNKLAVTNHLLIETTGGMDSNAIGTLELITSSRKAIVNNFLLQNLSTTRDNIQKKLNLKQIDNDKEFMNKINISDGDFIRIGYSNYKIYRDENSIVLDNITLNIWSPTNLFYLYSTTTYPDTIIGEAKGVKTTSILWLWLATSIVFYIFTYILTQIIAKLTLNMNSQRSWSIVQGVLFFSLFMSFLFAVSYINFTVMYFYQFNVYAKGSLFTEIAVFGFISLYGAVIYYIYKAKNIKENLMQKVGIILASYVVILLIFILLFHNNIYSSSLLVGVPKDMIIFMGEQLFIFSIFLLFAIFIIDGDKYVFLKVNISEINEKISIFIFYSTLALIVVLIFLVGIGMIKEGQGMVFIETAKIFIFLLLTLIFHHSFKDNYIQYTLWILLAIVLLLGIIGFQKDIGSILQVSLELFLLFLLFKDKFTISRRVAIAIIIGLIGAVFGAYEFVLKDNVRFAMWIDPFLQEIEPSTQYFMYRYEQLARGLFMIRNSSISPSDFINSSFIPLPAIHTDFIFVFFSNIFGWLGVGAILLSILLLIHSFKNSIANYSNESAIFQFIYSINSIYIVYMLSYFIINLSSVLQLIPLTDVPLPFLTYSKGILFLFIILFLFVAFFNIKYMQRLTDIENQKQGGNNA